jgi:CheY-like chemotaxis protein
VGYKILLADDSVTVQKIITLTFSDEGVDVLTVNNGDEAISRLQYVRPALVMADVSIPGKNGYEICEFVKTHPEMKDTPVILLVPAFERFDEERARRIGADYHLTKPFQSIRTLISTVKDLAERKAGAEFSVVGSGLTAVRGSELNDFEPAEFDPKRAKIDELLKISSEDNSESRVAESRIPESLVEDEILLEIDLTHDEVRYPESLALAPPGAIESVDEPTEEAVPFARVALMTDAIDQKSHASAETSNAPPPDLDLNDDVLELEDILADTGYVFAAAVNATAGPHSMPSSSRAAVDNHVEARAETQAQSQGGLIIPQSAIDEIVNRVSRRLSEELSEKLCGEIARRIAPEVAELIKRQFPAEVGAYRSTENLLDIE